MGREVTFTVSALGTNVYIETKNLDFKKYNTECSHSMLFATMRRLSRDLSELASVTFDIE